MRLIARTFALVLAACSATVLGQAPPRSAVPTVEPKVHDGDGWAIAAPADWKIFTAARPPAVIYLIGDGTSAVPLVDGRLSPLKAGLLVERFPAQGESLEERVQREARELKESKRFKFQSDPKTSEITLSDGVAGHSTSAKFVRLDNRRLSIQTKVYREGPEGDHLVATAFITCSPGGESFVRGISLDAFLESHALSLVDGASKLDPRSLEAAYEKLNSKAGASLQKTAEGNKLLAREEYPEATTAFREALALCDHVSAAHNGLAWALLHSKDAKPGDLAEALQEATKAVELTGETDIAPLDTLSLAYDRNGDRESAVKAVRKALKIEPAHPELRQRLESLSD